MELFVRLYPKVESQSFLYFQFFSVFFHVLTMARPSKRRSEQRSSIAEARLARRRQLAADKRRDVLFLRRKAQVDSMFQHRDRLRNDRGRSRSIEENRVTLLAMIASMQLWLELIETGVWDVLDWHWSFFDMKFARAMKQKQQHVNKLRLHFMEFGEVYVFGCEKAEESLRGQASPRYTSTSTKTNVVGW